MRVALVNYFHAGDVLLSRALIRRVRPLLIDRVALELRCYKKNAYLWNDLGLPLRGVLQPTHEEGLHVIDLWFGSGGDLLGVSGLTHATQVTSYNRQAGVLGLPKLDPSEPVPLIDFDVPYATDPPGVLVENGHVLSGQKTWELTPHLPRLADRFRGTIFYCTAKPPSGYRNIVDISDRNLIEISALSNVCKAMLARLSGPFVASLTARNRGRLPRLVLGEPIGCPIWDESDCSYYMSIEAVESKLQEILGP